MMCESACDDATRGHCGPSPAATPSWAALLVPTQPCTIVHRARNHGEIADVIRAHLIGQAISPYKHFASPGVLQLGNNASARGAIRQRLSCAVEHTEHTRRRARCIGGNYRKDLVEAVERRSRPELLAVFGRPLATKLLHRDCVGDDVPGHRVSQPERDFLGQVEMVEDVVDATVVWKTTEQSTYAPFCGLHATHLAHQPPCPEPAEVARSWLAGRRNGPVLGLFDAKSYGCAAAALRYERVQRATGTQ